MLDASLTKLLGWVDATVDILIEVLPLTILHSRIQYVKDYLITELRIVGLRFIRMQ